MDDQQAARELEYYEYRVYETPAYVGEPIEKEWELVEVFDAKWRLSNKVLVFRRPWRRKVGYSQTSPEREDKDKL